MIILIPIANPMAVKAPQIIYYLTMPEPHTHYFQVKMQVIDYQLIDNQDYIDFKMAVWTPGSYLIREYARHIENFSAQDELANPLKFKKINKNTWRIFTSPSPTLPKREGDFCQVEISYWVYAYELTVRTNFLDASHGYLNGACTFMYLADYQHIPAVLKIEPYPEWKKISAGLKPLGDNPFELLVPNFDILVDSPIELGNQTTFDFLAENIEHRVAFYGLPEFDQAQLSNDLTKIVSSATSIFGENPCEDYLFMSHFSQKDYGGLEHLNSTSLLFSRDNYRSEEGYKQFLSLCAHEYFHLWNVKRLRPAQLGPFDYENENFTTLLWQAEGFTTYFEKIILLKAQLISTKTYIKEILKRIQTIENQVGNRVQSLAESSLDAWIKAYRPHENSQNSTISYYTKGAVIAMLLDLEIIAASNGKRNLDNVMRYLYQKYYKEKDRGFTESEIQKALEKFAGKSLEDFFQKYIYGVEPIDYQPYFEIVGLKIQAQKSEKPDLGIHTDKRLITNVIRNSSAYWSGLNVNDEILAIAGKAEEDLGKWLETKQIGDRVIFMIQRDGYILPIEVKIRANTEVKYKVQKAENITQVQRKNYKKWLRMRF